MIKTVCFPTTYRCNARCGFCECRPESDEMLSLADMIRYMDEAIALGTVGQLSSAAGSRHCWETISSRPLPMRGSMGCSPGL